MSDQRVKRMKKLDRSGRERRGDLPMDLSLFKNIIMLKKKTHIIIIYINQISQKMAYFLYENLSELRLFFFCPRILLPLI